MRIRFGQTLIEFAIITTVVFCACFAAVYFFGDNIAAMFNSNKNDTFALFNTAKRAEFKPEKREDVRLTINGVELNSVISDSLKGQGYDSPSVLASGLSETVKYMLDKAINLLKLLNSLGDDVDKSALEAALADYLANPLGILLSEGFDANSETAKYLKELMANSSDSFKAKLESIFDPDILANAIAVANGEADFFAGRGDAEKIKFEIDTLLYNGADGTKAQNLENEINKIASNVTDEATKQLLHQYTSDIIALGSSADVQVSSQFMEEYSEYFEEYQNEVVKVENQEFFMTVDNLKNTILQKIPSTNQAELDADLKLYEQKLMMGDTKAAEIVFENIKEKYNAEFLASDLRYLPNSVGLTSHIALDETGTKINIYIEGVKAGTVNNPPPARWQYEFCINPYISGRSCGRSTRKIYLESCGSNCIATRTSRHKSSSASHTDKVWGNFAASELNTQDYTEVNKAGAINFKNYSMSDAVKYVLDKAIAAGRLNEDSLGMINVYQPKTTKEILPDSYDNQALCNSLNGNVENGSCQF